MTGELLGSLNAPSRRGFLKTSAILGGALLVPGYLAGCSSSDNSSSPAPASSAKPKPGGVLTLAITGAGTTEALNPFIRPNYIDILRVYNLYEGLVELTPGTYDEFTPGIAEVEQGPGSTYLVKIRDGVEFHNGQTVTAEDVVYSINYALDPKNAGQDQPLLSGYYPEGAATKSGTNEVTVATNFPITNSKTVLEHMALYFLVVPAGFTNWNKPVGTGPFAFKSFSPGKSSEFERFANYRLTDRPYFDSLVVNSVNDGTAKANALITGQVQAVDALDYTQARTYKSDNRVVLLETDSAGVAPFTMMCDTAPFDDVRVRKAFKLMTNRQQMVDQVLVGFGSVGADVPGKGLPNYPLGVEEVPYDPDQAKSLLAAAGYENLSVTLDSTQLPVIQQAATVFAEQAKAAGVTVKINNVATDQFFNTDAGYLQRTFSQTGSGGDFMLFAQNEIVSKAPYNETRWNNAEFDAIVAKAAREKSPETQAEVLAPAAKLLQEDGGFLMWGYYNSVDAYSPKIGGVVQSPYRFGLSNFGFKNWYYTA